MPKTALLCVSLLALPAFAFHQAPQPSSDVDYTLQVENTMGHEMDFSYSDADSTEHPLGTIPGYLKQKFTIKSPARTTVAVIERGAAMGSDYEMRKTVELVADSVATVAF
jgi:hypothetical protein